MKTAVWYNCPSLNRGVRSVYGKKQYEKQVEKYSHTTYLPISPLSPLFLCKWFGEQKIAVVENLALRLDNLTLFMSKYK